MRKIQRRKSDFMVKRQRGSAVYPRSRGLGCKTSGGRLLCTDRSGTEIFPNKQKCAGYIPEHCLPICKKRKERIKFMRDLEKVCIQPKYNYCTGEERFTFIKLPNKTNNNNINFNNIYLILSGSEETSLWMGYDGFQ